MSKYRVSIKLATIDALYSLSANPTVFTVIVDSLKFSIIGKQYALLGKKKKNITNSIFYPLR